MMKKTYVIVLLIILISSNILAYKSSIEKEILSFEDTELEIIIKSRKLIKFKLADGDLNKAEEIVDYLETRLDINKTVSLFPEEQLLLELIFHDYAKVIDLFWDNLKYFETGYYSLEGKIYPPNDWLYLTLKDYILNNSQDLKEQLYNAQIKDQEKEFIWLFTSWFLYDENSQENYEYINDQADLYLAKYPESSQSTYAEFIRTYIRYVYTLGNFGYGFDFFSGYGKFDGKLNEYFTSNVPIGVGFEISYKDIIFYLRDYIGVACKVRKEFEYKELWKKDLKQNVYMAEISVGYSLFENRKIKFTPFAGISGMAICPPEAIRKEEGNDVELNFSLAYDLGLNVDIKLQRGSGIQNEHWILRFRSGYSMPNFKRLDEQFSGSMFYLNIGFGGYFRPIVRDY